MGYGSFEEAGQSATAWGANAPFGNEDYEQQYPPSDHSIVRSGGGTPRTKVNLYELIFVPWLLLVIILVCYMQAGAYGYHAVLLLIPTILVVLNVWFLIYHYKKQDNPEVVLGILSLTAVVISLGVGCLGVYGCLFEFHTLSQGASYFNVLSSEPAAGKSDATALGFTNFTKVDLNRVFGWTDISQQGGSTYCVAPVSSGKPFENRIQYWAAGVDCCEARANFACYDATIPGTHAALVFGKDDAASSYGLRQAVAGAQALYGVTADPSYLLLKWHKDPVGYRNSLFQQTLTLFFVFGGVYLVISSMIGFALMPVFASGK